MNLSLHMSTTHTTKRRYLSVSPVNTDPQFCTFYLFGQHYVAIPGFFVFPNSSHSSFFNISYYRSLQDSQIILYFQNMNFEKDFKKEKRQIILIYFYCKWCFACSYSIPAEVFTIFQYVPVLNIVFISFLVSYGFCLEPEVVVELY